MLKHLAADDVADTMTPRLAILLCVMTCMSSGCSSSSRRRLPTGTWFVTGLIVDGGHPAARVAGLISQIEDDYSTLRPGPLTHSSTPGSTPTGNRSALALCDGLGQRRKLLVEILRIDRPLLLDRRLCPANSLGDRVGQRGLAHDDECRRP